MKADTVIIGSGISGLTLGALLSKHGRDVVICDRHSRPGGSIKSFKRQGVSFDTGFHYSGSLGKGELLCNLWEYLGILKEIDIITFPEHGHDLLIIGKKRKEVRAFFNYRRFMSELYELFPKEKKAIDTYFNKVDEICSKVPFYNPELNHDSFHSYYFKYFNVRLSDFLSSLTSDHYLHAALSVPSFLYGVPPEKANLSTHARVAHSFYTGASGIRGGGQSLVNAFLDKIKGYGGKVVSRFEVAKVLEKNGRVAGVMSTSGETVQADEVIFSGNPKVVPEIVNHTSFRPAFLHRLADLESTMSMFMLFGAKPARSLCDLIWKNIWRVPFDTDFFDFDSNSSENMIMISAPSIKERGCEDDRLEGVMIMAPTSWGEASKFCGKARERLDGYKVWKAREMDRLLYTAGQAGLSDIYVLETATPCTFRDELASPYGGVYGVQQCYGQYNPGPVTRLPGFWLTGQAVVLPGIVGASISALVTGDRMPGMEGVWKMIA